MSRILAFTAKSDGIASVLATPVEIFKEGQNQSVEIQAIWDTGATGTTITKQVAEALGLIATGFTQVHTANGVATQHTYTIDLGLPNRFKINKITVTEVDQLSGGFNALIGMNIISLGDFSVTNHNGKTCFSFRMPSSHEIDYVESPDFGTVKVEKEKASGGENFKMSLEQILRQKRLDEINNKKKQ